MSDTKFSRRLNLAKRSFVTRRVDLNRAASLTNTAPSAGDLCLARIDRLGHHSRLELPTGRRAYLNPGDEVLLAFGARYATDQFHSIVPSSLAPCQMVAAGGIASKMITRHAKTRVPTQITPIGLLTDSVGEVLNLRDFAIEPARVLYQKTPHLICVVGSSMNAGKTTTVAELGRMALRGGLRPCAIKLTGTGSGGDLWKYTDSGIDPVFDFTDGGYATTVGVGIPDLEDLLTKLIGASGSEVDLVIIEIADGLYQNETAGLLASPGFRARMDSVVFAASDPMSGMAGVQYLRDLGLEPSAVSGAVTASPLAAQELAETSGVEIFSLERMLKDDNGLNICLRSAHATEGHRFAKSA